MVLAAGCASGAATSGVPSSAGGMKPAPPTPTTAPAAPKTAAMPHCPPEVVDIVRSVDLTLSTSTEVFSQIASSNERACEAEAMVAIAARIDASADDQVRSMFCSETGTYARFFSDEDRATIEAAYRRIPYVEHNAKSYFIGLQYNRIDIRDHLRGKIREDWSFTSPDHHAQTWFHFMYLASMDEPGAYGALERKIGATRSGNDVFLLLTSLSSLHTPRTKAILERYRDEKRLTDGADGPGAPVGTLIRITLDSW